MLFKDNPFYILNIPCTATRRQISEKVEELSLLDESQEYQDAQASLLNPVKRLNAELSWVDVNEEERNSLVDAIQKGQSYDYSAFSEYTKLNLAVYCFGVSEVADVTGLVKSVTDLNDAYVTLDVEKITERINSIHEIAGIHGCTEEEISNELQEMRYSVKKSIQTRVHKLSEKDYPAFALAVAQEAEKSYDSCILDDIIDDYAIDLQSKIETGFEEIKDVIAEITEKAEQQNLATGVDNVIDLIKQWVVLIRPMQIVSGKKGLTETYSEKLSHVVQELLKYLNDSKKTELAVKAANEIGKELVNQNELSEQFKEISKVLTNNIAVEPLLQEIAALKNGIDTVKRTRNTGDVNTVINKVYKSDRLIKELPLEKEEKDKLKAVIFLMARNLSVELYNAGQITLACKIFYVLDRLYSGDPEHGIIIARDHLTIGDNPRVRRELAAQSPYYYSESPESIEKNKKQLEAQNNAKQSTGTTSTPKQSSADSGGFWAIILGVVLVLVVIFIIAGTGSSKKKSTNTTTTAPHTTAATTQAPTTAATTAAPTEAPHGQYYRVTADSLNVRDSKNRDTVVGTLSKGAIIEEIGSYENDNWVLFEMNGKEVVAYKEYLEKTSQGGSSSKNSQNGNQSKYKEYSSSSAIGSEVYVKVSYIEPSVGISETEGGKNKDIVCKCKNENGTIFWLYMSLSDYYRNVDSTAKLEDSDDAYFNIKEYTTYPIIYGTVMETEYLSNGLSSMINSKKLWLFRGNGGLKTATTPMFI